MIGLCIKPRRILARWMESSGFFRNYHISPASSTNCEKYSHFLRSTVRFSECSQGMVDLSGFRTLRILKTLRTIPFFDGIGVILESLRLSTRLLLDIIAFMMFYFVIYGLVSVNFFKGRF